MRKPIVFISHSTSRLDVSQRPVQVREHLYELLLQDWEVFLDVKSLEPGEMWRDTLLRKLDQADAAVVLIDGGSAESDWLSTEWSILGFRKANAESFQLVPLLLADVNPEDPRFRRFMPTMQNHNYLRDDGRDARALAEWIVGKLTPRRVHSTQFESPDNQDAATSPSPMNAPEILQELAKAVAELGTDDASLPPPSNDSADLARAFEDAVKRWLDLQDPQWVLPWVGPNCPALMYAQHLGCNFSKSDLERITQLLKSCHNGRFAAQKYERCGRPELVANALQCEMLLRGMASTMVAGNALRPKLAEPVTSKTDFGEVFQAAVSSSFQCYQRAWETSDHAKTSFSLEGADDVGENNVIDTALRQVLLATPTTLPAYLAVRRLLTFLLRRPLTEHRVTEATLLFYHNAAQEGETGTVSFWTEPAPESGFYLDPVSLGLTVLDQQLLGSLHTAWDACRAKELPGRASDPRLAVRLSPYLPDVDAITADSAGVIFACGMSAALQGKQIDRNVTVTAVLGQPDDQGRNVKLEPVEPGSLRLKLDAAARKQVRQVVLQAEQASSVLRNAPPEVYGAETLDDVFKFVLGDDAMESALLSYSHDVLKRWKARCQDPDDPDGLNRFIEPHYRVPERDGLTGKAFGIRRQVEGEDGHRTVNLLKWAKENTRHHRVLLCLPSPQGFGKTVFSLHAQATVSDSPGRRALADGKGCLAVRWGRNWPDDYLQALCAEVEPHKGIYTAKEIVEWAIDNGRVYLILDALDEVPHADKVNRLAEFLEHRGSGCHVILTTRPFAVEKYQSLLFNVSGWTMAHLDGLDDWQQEELVDDLVERVPHRAGIKHLLRVPLVLSMIRTLKTRQPQFKTPAGLYLATHDEHIERLIGKAADPDLQLISRILATTGFESMLSAGRHVRLSALQEQVSRRIKTTIAPEVWRLAEQVTELVKWRSNADNDVTMPPNFRNNWLEFYCGYFLAAFADAQALGQAAGYAGDPAWYWPWRFAIELADHAPDKAALVESLSLLFGPPTDTPRPAELMFRAWPLMQALDGGQVVIENFRSQPAGADKPRFEMVCCPPAGATRESAPGTPFDLAVLRVTNEQFARFDRSHEKAYEVASEQQRPASVNRFQAWMFCRWLGPGFRLPELREWDFLAREKMALADADDPMENPLDVYPDAIRRDVGTNQPNAWGIHDMPRLFAEWWDDREPADEFAELQVAPIADGFLDLAIESQSYRDIDACNLNLFRVARSR